MRSYAFTAAAWLAILPAAAGAVAQTISFEMIPFALGANDMSPDGRYVVGEADWDEDGFADGSYLMDFVTGDIIDLENTVDPTTGVPVTAVSDDGRFALGTMKNPEEPNNPMGDVAGMWSADAEAWESLGYLPNAGHCPGRSSGYEISADGSVAVGLSWDGCNGVAFRWTDATGMVALDELGNGGNRASVVSADGNVIGGFAQGTQSRTPAVWSADGSGELLDPSAFALGARSCPVGRESRRTSRTTTPSSASIS
jgi:probable HAF family extracellular repeat protein